MANINTGIFRHFRNGGVFEIEDIESGGGTADVLYGVEENSLGFTPGMHEVYTDRENGTLLTDYRRGDEQETMLQLRVKVTAGMLATAGVLGVWLDQQKATDDGKIRKYDIVCKFPTLPDGAAGATITFADCVLDPGSVQLQGGQNYDVLTAQFRCPHGAPTFGTY